MITLTQVAAEKVTELSKEHVSNKDGSFFLRARVLGGGCAGFSYDLYFEESDPAGADEVFESHGVRIVVDQLSMQYLDGTVIDYTSNVMESGFRFNNPNSTGSCGCGSSFSA